MDARRRRERASAHHVSAATTASAPARSFDSMNVTLQALSVRNEDTGVKTGGVKSAVCERTKIKVNFATLFVFQGERNNKKRVRFEVNFNHQKNKIKKASGN